MTFFRQLRFAPTAITFIIVATLSAGSAVADPGMKGAHSRAEETAILAQLGELESWLDVHTDLPAPERGIAWIVLTEAGADIPFDGQSTHLRDGVRSVYDESSATIYLIRPWWSDIVRDRSILLHEMVHHRQTEGRLWVCPQAMEWDAYHIQDDYLVANGEVSGFNWLWVALSSSCEPRDYHPS